MAERVYIPLPQNSHNVAQTVAPYQRMTADPSNTSSVVQNSALSQTAVKDIMGSQPPIPSSSQASSSLRHAVPQVSKDYATVATSSTASEHPNDGPPRPLTNGSPSSEEMEKLSDMLRCVTRNPGDNSQGRLMSDAEKLWPVLGPAVQQYMHGCTTDEWRRKMAELVKRQGKDAHTLPAEEAPVLEAPSRPQRDETHESDVQKQDKGKGREVFADIPPSQAPQEQSISPDKQRQIEADHELALRLQDAERRELRPRRGQAGLVQGSRRDTEYVAKRDAVNESNGRKAEVEAKKKSGAGNASGRKAAVQGKKAASPSGSAVSCADVQAQGPKTKGKKAASSEAPTNASDSAATTSSGSQNAKPQRADTTFANEETFTFRCLDTLSPGQLKRHTCIISQAEAHGGSPQPVSECIPSTPGDFISTEAREVNLAQIEAAYLSLVDPCSSLMDGPEYNIFSVDDMPDFCGVEA